MTVLPDFPIRLRNPSLFCWILLSCAFGAHAQEPNSPPPKQSAQTQPRETKVEKNHATSRAARLKLKRSVERELKGGSTDTYEIKAKKGQFLHVVAEQKGIDVVLVLVDPIGKVLVEADSPNAAWGPEPASLIAAMSGVYQAQVKSLDKNAAAGKYAISVVELRTPKPDDAIRIGAEHALFAAALMAAKTDADSTQKAFVLYEKALGLWQAARDPDPYEEALCWSSMGDIQSRGTGAEDTKKATEFYKRALALHQAAGNRPAEAKTLNAMGMMHFSVYEYPAALEYFQRALLAMRAAREADGEIEVLQNIGHVYRELNQRQEALKYYEQALEREHASGDLRNQGVTLDDFGGIYKDLGEKQKAMDYYNQALTAEQAADDSDGEAVTLGNIGSLYLSFSENQKALEYFMQALPVERASGNRNGEAATLNNIGRAYDGLGEKQKALEYLNLALALRREARNRRGEAAAVNNIALVYDDLGEKQKALENFMRVLAMLREIGDRENEGNTLNNIGGVYDDLGEQKKAIEYHSQALQVRREVGDRSGEATSLNNLALACDELGDKKKALDYYNQAALLFRELGQRNAEATVCTNIGLLYSGLGEPQKALEYYNQALPTKRELGDRLGEAVALLNIGEAYADLREPQKALDNYNTALALFRASQNALGEGKTLDELMKYWRGESNPGLAIFFGKQSVNAFQQIRRNIQGLDAGLQKSFLESKANVYRELGDLLISQGRLPEAQQVLDLMKEQEYFEFVRGGASAMEAKSQPVSLNPEEQASHEAYEKIAGQVTALGAEFSELRAKRTRTAQEEARFGELKDKLTLANQEMGRFFKTLYVEFGKNAQANQSTEVVREETSAMQTLVRELGPGTIALYTLVGEARYSVIVITASTMQAREYPIAATDLRKKVATLLEALKNPASDPLPASQELYKILISPMAEDLKGAKAQTLMWSLNDVLRYVPMAALHDGKQYLVENYRNVVITPASIGRIKDKVDLSDSSIAGMGVSKDYDGLGALPAVPEELKHIVRDTQVQASTGVIPGTMLLDDDFTEAHMASALDKHYPVVHIASHFVLQAGNETNSYLLLGGKDVGGKGYHLTLAELRDDPALTFDGTELLTLSACQTATSGTALNGREVDGLGITAQHKGAKAVLASLWSVADESTALLMADFYKLWLTAPGNTKAGALRQAQLDMLHGGSNLDRVSVAAGDKAKSSAGAKNSAAAAHSAKDPNEKKATPSYAHPFYWAPFVLIGNWK